MSEILLAPVLIGLALGVSLIILFSLILSSDNAKTPIIHVSTVIIPNGAAIYGSDHNNFEPSLIRVKVNNTVRWVNEDSVPSSVMANDSGDPNFVRATQDNNGYPTDESELMPHESFEYTFTKTGVYGYHSVPHPWMQGTVIVLPNLP